MVYSESKLQSVYAPHPDRQIPSIFQSEYRHDYQYLRNGKMRISLFSMYNEYLFII